MTKIKKMFSTPKKAVVTIACILAILVAMGAGTVYIAGTIAESSSIGAENAMNFAFADAGVDPVDARNIETEFEFKQGQFVYEVKFVANSSEYKYWIKASNGSVVKKEVEIISDAGNTTLTATVTLDEAKDVALDDAGLTSSEVIFTKAKLDMENGISVYDIEFYAKSTEYEYEINANTGDVYSKSKETHVENTPDTSKNPEKDKTKDELNQQTIEEKKPTNNEQTTTGSHQTANNEQTTTAGDSKGDKNQLPNSAQISLDTAKEKAITDAGISSSEVYYTKGKLDHDDGILVYDIEFYTSTHKYEYEIDANTGEVHSKSVEVIQTNTGNNGNNNGNYIGIEKAKAIAVSHSGFSVTDVVFSKAKLDHDDGIVVYDIEFYKNGMEYEYEINAITGEILEYDWD